MKSSLKTALAALLCVASSSFAAGQQRQTATQTVQAAPATAQATAGNPYPLPGNSQASAPQAPLPVTEAKKRYLATQEQLQSLLKGGWRHVEFSVEQSGADLLIGAHYPRERVRAAVAEDFDARRQLQQAELAELENRIQRIKRGMEIRDAMRDTLVDQRTDELLDQLEHGGKPDGSAAPGGGRPTTSGVKQPAPPDNGTVTVKEESQLLKQQLDEAKANFESAERAYERARRLFQQGAISEEVLAEEQQKQKTAKLMHDRCLLQMDAFLEAHRSGVPETKAKEPPARDGAVNDPNTTPDHAAIVGAPVADGALADNHGRFDAKLAALESDVAEAKANRESAEREYKRFEKMGASGAIEQAIVDEKVEQCKRSQIQLERQELRRDAFLQTHRADATGKPADGGGAAVPEFNRQLAALDVQDAESYLAEQQIRHQRYQRLLAAKAIEPPLADEQAETYKRAQIQLEQAKANLKALTEPAAGDRPVDKPQ